MEINLFNDFHLEAEQSGILFYYSGDFTQYVIGTIAEILKQRLDKQDPKGVGKRIFSTFIELAQHALNFTPKIDKSIKPVGAVMVGKKSEKFFILLGSLVDNQHVEKMAKVILQVNSMTLEELKVAYHEQLITIEKDNEEELSFLKIARTSCFPIEYKVKQIRDMHQFSELYLKVIF